jgi:hypothetical protein
LIQKVEQHSVQRTIAPTTQTKIQNIEKVEIEPLLMKEEQHVVRKEIAPIIRKQNQNIQKKVIQPIIKDIIQPVHIRVKPELQEGIKPTIFTADKIHQAVVQRTENLPAAYQGTKVEAEVMSGTHVRQSIIKSSVLPTDYKPTQFKPEIGGDGQAGMGMAGGMRISSGVHKEINAGTTVRPSIVRTSVLPTINGGVNVLKTVYGGSTTSYGQQYGTVGLGTNTLTTTTTTTQYGNESGNVIVQPTLNLETTVKKLDTNSVISPYRVSSIGVGNSTTTSTGQIMGVNPLVGDNAADVTYSTKPNN